MSPISPFTEVLIVTILSFERLDLTQPTKPTKEKVLTISISRYSQLLVTVSGLKLARLLPNKCDITKIDAVLNRET